MDVSIKLYWIQENNLAEKSKTRKRRHSVSVITTMMSADNNLSDRAMVAQWVM
jgi:hypothetical protein